MIRRWLVTLGLWLAHLGGWTLPFPEPCRRLHATSPYLDTARLIHAEVERQQMHNGEQKRHAALRAMLNRHPEARERDLALAIELAVQERA